MTIKKTRLKKALLYLKYITFVIEYESGLVPERKREMQEERMLKWFEYSHLPPHLQEVSKPFGELAATLVSVVDGGPERTVALRKLLEAKDAAVRAKLNPGG